MYIDRLSLTAVFSEQQKAAVDKLNLGGRSEAQELYVRLTTVLFFSFSNSQKQYYATVCAVSIFRLHKSLQKQHFLGLE